MSGFSDMGDLEPQPSTPAPAFGTWETTNLRLNSLQKITYRSCILVKKMSGEGARCSETASTIFQPPLPFN
jgi:hypothetical protein